MAAAVGSGLVMGGIAGAAVRGSGSLYDILLFIGVFLAVLVVAVAGAVFATMRGHPAAARRRWLFIAACMAAWVAAYAVGPHYRSPDAPEVAAGTVTVRLTAPEGINFEGAAECMIERGRTAVSHVTVLSARAGQRYVIVMLEPGVDGSGSPARLTLSFSSSAGGSDYTAAAPGGLTPTTTSPDGRSGSFTFVVDRVEAPQRVPDPTFDRIVGTVGWTCE